MNRYSKLAAVLCAVMVSLLAWAVPAHAGWSQPFDVSPSVSEAPEATGLAEIAALPDGGFIYVWNQTNQDGSVSVVSRVSYPDGSVGPINTVVAGSDSGSTDLNPFDPTVATGGDGSIRVAWTWQKIFCSPGCDYRYEAQTAMLDGDGKVSGSIQSLDATSPNTFDYIGPVSISIASDGYALLTWRFADNGTGVNIRSALADPGQPVGASDTEHFVPDSSPQDPQAAALDGGGGFISFPEDSSTLKGLMLDADGDGTAPQTLDTGPFTLHARTTLIAPDGTGTVVYIREDGVQAQIFTRKMSSTGTVLGTDAAMVSEEDTDRWSNYMENGSAMDSDGTIVVAWNQALVDGGDTAVRTRTIAPDGSLGPIATAAEHADEWTAYASPAISPDGGGSIIYQRSLDMDDAMIMVRELDDDLAPTGTATEIAGSQVDSTIEPRAIAYSDNGDAAALFVDFLFDQWEYAGLRSSILETTPPVVNVWVQEKAVQGQGIVVTSSATDRSGPIAYDWDFGDGGSANTQTAEHTYAEPGNFTVTLTATDGAGNSTTDTSQIEIIAAGTNPPPDPIPPNTLINGKPAKKTKSKAATFKFVSSLTGSKFECRLDKAGWSDCKSPKKLKKLKPGKHTFKVRALKGDLFDKTPASYSWTVKKAKKTQKGGRK